MRVLVVEDYVAYRSALERLLRRAGHEVRAAGSGPEALEEQSFDLILSDMGLPGMDGWELLGHVRRRHPVKAIALTAHAEPSDFERSRNAGFAAHLVKPVEWETLAETIARVAG